MNPQYQCSRIFQASADMKIGLYDCFQKMIPDAEDQLSIDLQMDAFRNARGLLGLPTTIMTRTKTNPSTLDEVLISLIFSSKLFYIYQLLVCMLFNCL